MSRIPPLIAFMSLTAAAPHSGVVTRDGFEPSDVALFVVAATGIWLARRAMRARAKVRRSQSRD
ncbi:hypothetical protein [Stakelama saccharophila]|uniref:Uncharacterized protein n=1 Tax=Stakelama saccharophila TaxID=3075605 RepID=A0ABZ0BDW5_9SPHN|nr:hypothetical protein [Stakelama sp. W311]WNO54534.1 hypothetical protein RPR59_04565 [Stakelama sp. W311]